MCAFSGPRHRSFDFGVTEASADENHWWEILHGTEFERDDKVVETEI